MTSLEELARSMAAAAEAVCAADPDDLHVAALDVLLLAAEDAEETPE